MTAAAAERPSGGYSPRAKKQGISAEEAAVIAATYGPGLIAAIEAVLTVGFETSKRAQHRLAVLSILLWATRTTDDAVCRAFIELYREGGPATTGGAAVVPVTLAVARFHAALLAAGRLRASYCHNMAGKASVVLVRLGRSGGRAPALPDNIFKESQPRTSTHTLGGLGWAELQDLDEAQRDAVALSLTRGDAMAYFRGDLATFEFGR